MNDILGILISMLMSGAGIVDVFRALGGAGSGAAGMDGLEAMLSAQKRNARLAVPLVQNQSTINQAAELVVDRIGIDPYSGIGQGAARFLGGMYHVAPDVIGSVLGIPNGGQFFTTVANGASAISRASGGGTPDIFNPYSVIAAHQRTMNLARQVYDLGVRKEGGYDVNFGHGLNMDEMGKVTQRLLASDIPYREYAKNANGEPDFSQETGERLDPNKAADAEKFSQNLKKLGAKFNEAVSMLSKVTGSVDEALTVMDRLGGGNFLGGTAEQASAVANKARKMATAIRVTSAIAGISPQEAYANMSNLQQSMAAGMGLSPYVANASGATGLMRDMAFNGTMAFNAWAAMNPKASPERRKQALFAANGRAQAYATSNGAALAAAVADNANLFTQEELELFKTSYREGRPNDMAGLVRQRIGTNMYTEYMTDPAMQLAARKRASEENPELLKAIDEAGEEGNLAQAESFGSKRILDKTLADMESTVRRTTGKSDFTKNVDNAAKQALYQMARKAGMPKEMADKMSADQLRAFLKESPDVDQKERAQTENVARITEARKQIQAATLTDEDEASARDRLRREIASTAKIDDEKKKDLLARLNDGKTSLDTVFRDVSRFYVDTKEKTDLRNDIFGGKMTKEESARQQSILDRAEKSQKTDFTAQERMADVENHVKQSNLQSMGQLKNLIASKNLGKLENGDFSDQKAVETFASRVAQLRDEGRIAYTEGDANLDKTFSEATQRVLSSDDIFGNSLGGMKDDALKAFKQKKAEQIIAAVRGGSKLEDAFASVLEEKNLTEDEKNALGKNGMDQLANLRKQAADPRSELRRRDLNMKAILASATGVLESRTSDEKTNAVEEMKKLASGDFGKLTESQALDRFAELAHTADEKLFSGKKEDLASLKTSAIEKVITQNVALSEEDRRAIAQDAQKRVDASKGKMGYGEAIAASLNARANQDGISQDNQTKMRDAATKIGKDEKVGKSVLSAALGQMKPEGLRVDTFGAMYAGGNANTAALIMAAGQARMLGLDLHNLNLGEGWEDLVSEIDRSQADATQNRIPNALRVGGASYYREAIKDTKAQISTLRDALTVKGKDGKPVKDENGNLKLSVSNEDLQALTDKDENKVKAARDKVRGILSTNEKTKFDVDHNMAVIEEMVKSDRKVGGVAGLQVLTNEGAAAKAFNGETADADLVDVTKSANIKNSASGELLGAIGEVIRKVAPVLVNPVDFFTSNPLPVNIKNSIPLDVR